MIVAAKSASGEVSGPNSRIIGSIGRTWTEARKRVLFSDGELCWKRGAGGDRGGHSDEGET
jgi:hypothetical protein